MKRITVVVEVLLVLSVLAGCQKKSDGGGGGAPKLRG
jgi:predicted small secreted protein